MVSDGSMLQSVGSFENQPMTPRLEQASKGMGIQYENYVKLPDVAAVENNITIAKHTAEQRSAEQASLAQQNIDSFAMANNKSPREADPFSTAGTVFNART